MTRAPRRAVRAAKALALLAASALARVCAGFLSRPDGRQKSFWKSTRTTATWRGSSLTSALTRSGWPTSPSCNMPASDRRLTSNHHRPTIQLSRKLLQSRGYEEIREVTLARRRLKGWRLPDVVRHG